MESESYQNILKHTFNSILEDKVPLGNAASYIPELSVIDPSLMGVQLELLNGVKYGFGDAKTKFSIQSISKVFSLILAYQYQWTELWSRVGVEPSGTPYNSLILLELEKGVPRNPFINAGAIVIADVLISELKHPEQDFLQFIRKISCNDDITYSESVYKSEKSVAYRNYSLVNLMKSMGNIHNDIDQVMDFYFKICSIMMTCEELTESFLFLANRGVHPITGKKILEPSMCKRINSIMQLCGFYDEAGEFSFRVGLPGKSGVGGGIVAVQPNKYCISVWSPGLNRKGNSLRGIEFLERFTSNLGDSIF